MKTIDDVKALAASGKLCGIYNDIPNEVYHSGPGLSRSDIMLLNKSPAHYKNKVSKDSEAMKDGRFYHTAILEPHLLEDLFYKLDEKIDRRTKVGKQRYAEIVEEAGSREIIDVEKYDRFEAIRNKLWDEPLINSIFDGGESEVTVYNDMEGFIGKARADRLNVGKKIITDLKFVDDARQYQAEKKARNYYWDVQAAWYLRQFSAAYDFNYEDFIFIFVEKDPPYEFAIYNASKDMIAEGEGYIDKGLQIYREALRTGAWPGYNRIIQPIDTNRFQP